MSNTNTLKLEKKSPIYIKPPPEFWDTFDFEDFQKNYYNKYDIPYDVNIIFTKPKSEKTIIKVPSIEFKNSVRSYFIDYYKALTLCTKCGLNEVNISHPTMVGYPYGIPDKIVYFAFGQSLHSYNPRNIYFQIPFKGNIPKKDSGILLYNSFNLAGIIERENLMVSNVVKCHPPNNRPSKPEEITICSKNLLNEIYITKPLVLIPIGKDAWESIWKTLKFSKEDWQEILNGRYASLYKRKFSKEKLKDRLNSVNYIIKLVHPSYIQRRGNKKEEVKEYMKEVITLNKYIIKDIVKYIERYNANNHLFKLKIEEIQNDIIQVKL